MYYANGLADGKELFKSWFLKKSSGIFWSDRHNFEQRPGGYNFVELSTEASAAGKKSAVGDPKCKLPPRVASFVQLVFDEVA